MEQFANFGPVQAVRKFWDTLTPTQRFVSAVFMSTSVVLLVVVSVVATRPQMAVLFSGLDSSDAGAVVGKLQERNVPYQVTGGGAVIEVPAKQVHETRLALATEGLPQGGSVGFEIFDKTSLGMTEFSQRLNYQRALQGELARTISQLDRVEQARVHVSIPEPSVFASKEKHATASIVMKLRPGRSLQSDQVRGIVHLVSAAVEGLEPNYVTVVDTRGNVLSESGGDTEGADPRLSASQLQVRANYEDRMQKDIQSMLERVLGANKAVVRVSAEMNFDRRETSSETYQPAESGRGVLLSEENLEETYTGGSGTVGGVPGVRGNIQPLVSSSSGGEGGYSRVETNSKYEVSRTTEHVVKAPGVVEQVSVAVMLDEKVDAAKIPAVSKAVQAAVGADPARGDKVIVESVPFDDSAIKEEKKSLEAAAANETYLSIAKGVGGVLLLVGFLFFLSRMFRRIKVAIPERTVAPAPSARQVVASPGTIPERPAAQPESSPILQDLEEKQPEEVAQVIKSWISE